METKLGEAVLEIYNLAVLLKDEPSVEPPLRDSAARLVAKFDEVFARSAEVAGE